MNRFENFKAGLIKDNPVFSLFLGICSTLAITTTVNNAIGMGVSVIIVLIMSNVIISCVRKITPDEIRIPVYIVIIATLVKNHSNVDSSLCAKFKYKLRCIHSVDCS